MPGNRTLTRWLRLGCKCQFHVRSFLYSSMTSVIASSLCMRMAWNKRGPILLLHLQSSVNEMHMKGPAENPMIGLGFAGYEIVCHTCIFLNLCTVPQQAQRVYSFLYPLRAASWWDLGYAKECHKHDAGPMWQAVSGSHSGIQHCGFPLHWLQKYRWASSRWTCHSLHLQDTNSQQGKTEGQRKLCCGEFCWTTWEAQRWRWNTMLF